MSRSLRSIHNELLVIRCQHGDTDAMGELIARWQAPLRAHAWNLTGSMEAAADVCQEAWFAIARSIRRLNDPANFRGWAYRIVTRRCADWTRSRQRERRLRQVAERAARVGCEAPEAADDAITVLRRAIVSLDAPRRAVLSLHYEHQFTVNQIAAALDIPAGTVKSRLHHAREALRNTLERRTS